MALTVNTNIINDTDQYLLDAKNVKGTFVVVASTTERDALPAATRVNGSLCFCTADSKFYQYNGSKWNEAKLGGVELGTTSTTAAKGDHTHNYAASGTAGGSASQITVTDTTPAANTTYYLHYSTGKSGAQDTRANNELYYYDSGSWSSLNIGSSSNAGILTLHQNNGKYGDLQVATLTANRAYTFPDKTGTVALTSDISYPVTKVANKTGAVTVADLVAALGGTSPSTLAIGSHEHTSFSSNLSVGGSLTTKYGVSVGSSVAAVGFKGQYIQHGAQGNTDSVPQNYPGLYLNTDGVHYVGNVIADSTSASTELATKGDISSLMSVSGTTLIINI